LAACRILAGDGIAFGPVSGAFTVGNLLYVVENTVPFLQQRINSNSLAIALYCEEPVPKSGPN
jgi:hypothetical protein